MGKTVFTFGAQKKAGDFYVPSDRIKVHSQLVVHPGGRITIGFCNAQVITCPFPCITPCIKPCATPK